MNTTTKPIPRHTHIGLTPEFLDRLKPEIFKRADAIVDRANRMLAGKFTAREFECLWVGVMEWKHFIEALIPRGAPEGESYEADTISGKLDWMMAELRQAVELARANPIRVVVGIDGGKFRGASASHIGVKVEAFDWDAERRKAIENFAAIIHSPHEDEVDDEAQAAFANATKGLVVLC